MTVTGDLTNKSGDDDKVQMTHKEESPSCIVQDVHDRLSLRAALQSRIDPMDPVTHVAGCLLNIASGEPAQPGHGTWGLSS